MSAKGEIYVYFGAAEHIGNAAIGMAFQAAVAGKKVLFTEFCPASKRRGGVTMSNSGIHYLLPTNNSDTPFSELDDELKRIVLLNNTDYFEVAIKKAPAYDMLILDGVFDATAFGVLYEGILADFLASKPENLTVVITGMYASAKIAAYANKVAHVEQLV